MVVEIIATLTSEGEFEAIRNSYFASREEADGFGPYANGCIPDSQRNCGWWGNLSQADRNNRIVTEALYSVDRNIWVGIRCPWYDYYEKHTCCDKGTWSYSCNYPSGKGGECKEFAKEVLLRTSGGSTTLPGGTYNYTGTFPYRNKSDATRYALPGEVLQFTGNFLHTAFVITNFHNGKFEVVDSNWCDGRGAHKIGKHVIDVNSGSLKDADCKSYVIGCYYQP